jgi:hypothetical protein
VFIKDYSINHKRWFSFYYLQKEISIINDISVKLFLIFDKDGNQQTLYYDKGYIPIITIFFQLKELINKDYLRI